MLHCALGGQPCKIPWSSEEVDSEKGKRRQLERCWRKCGLEIFGQMYQHQRNKVNALLARKKANYYRWKI
jgi:hypothetical protein